MALFQQSLMHSVMGDLQSTGYGLWGTRNVSEYSVCVFCVWANVML